MTQSINEQIRMLPAGCPIHAQHELELKLTPHPPN